MKIQRDEENQRREQQREERHRERKTERARMHEDRMKVEQSLVDILNKLVAAKK